MKMIRRTSWVVGLMLVVCGSLAAQDYGDAPASYGLAQADASLDERLGAIWTGDATNPVTPAWTGDASDDGVATLPLWSAGLSTNSVTVDVDTDNYTEYFTMWIDLNDDGDFTDTGERFDHPSFPTTVIGSYTFSNIALPAQNYTLNGVNKIAVRFILKYNSAITGPSDAPSYGEVEDYLFDVSPPTFTIITPSLLPDANVGNAYNQTLQTVSGVGNVSWALTSGALPPGLSLSPADVLSGTPTTAAAGQNYNFTVTATDSNTPPDTDQKSFSLNVIGLVVNETSPLISAIEGQSYNQTFTVSNGGPSYTWSLSSGAIPPGLTLTQSGDDYILAGTPGAGAGGVSYNFTIQVTDGAMTEQKVFDLYVIEPPAQLPFTDDFSTDKGWTLGSGQVTWTIDVCGPAYTPPYGNPEPTTDHSPSGDNRILGDNIGAIYPNSMTGTVWAESPAVDCGAASDVELVFWRALGLEDSAYDHGYIEISPDNGQNWTQVWTNGGNDIADTGWTEQKVNISSVAGNQSAVKVRFGIGSTDGSVRYAGWCIDDFEIRELPSTSKLVLQDFTITSAYSVGTSNPAPECYTGSQYPFELTLDNTTANVIDVNTLMFEVTEFGSTTPENVGTWTVSMTVPFSVPASATGFIVSGTFDCASLSTTGAGIALENNCKIQGIEQGAAKPVETELNETFYLDTGPPPPPPSMQVHEISFSGPTVDSAQSATGTNRDFGVVDIDSGPGAWVNIVVLNTTGMNIDVDEPILTGADAAHFRLDTAEWTSPTMTLTTSGAGSQIFFSVRLDPHDVGQLNAEVEFTHTAMNPSANPFIVPLTGTGTGNPPELEVHEVDFLGPKVTNAQPAAGTNRDFGTVAPGGFSQWVNIVLWNRFVTDTTIGAGPQNMMPEIASGPDATHFDIDISAMNTPHTIGGTTTFIETIYFSIRFSPDMGAATGQKTATVQFEHDASSPTANPFTFEITGNVGMPGPAFSIYELTPTGAPSFGINNGDAAVNGRDFGAHVVSAGASTPLRVEIRNTGSSVLTLGNPQIVGADAGDFVVDLTSMTPQFTTSVGVGASTEFWVAFDPATDGQKNATIEFTHSATTHTTTPFVFDVTGLGQLNAPIVEVNESSPTGPVITFGAAAAGTGRDFGSQDVNAGATTGLTIHITNAGLQNMNVGVPAMAGANASEFTVSATGFPVVIAPGSDTSFTVRFDPDTFGNKTANVEFSHDDPSKTNPYSFEVTGFGDAPSIEVHEGAVAGPIISHAAAPTAGRDFGSVALASMPSAPVTIFVVNGGNADLNVSTPTITGSNSTSFALDLGATTFPAVVAPGSDISFNVQFTATLVGLKQGTVNIAHNDAGATSPFTFDIQGVATDPNGVRITTTTMLPPTKIGVNYTETLRASGGTTPYTWALLPGEALPSGLTLAPGGDLSGAITASTGVYQFEVRVTDNSGGTDDQIFSLAIGSDSTGSSPGSGGSGCIAAHGVNSWTLILGALALGILIVTTKTRRPA